MNLKETRLYAIVIVLVVVLASMSGYLVAATQLSNSNPGKPIIPGEGTETEQLKTLVVSGMGWARAKPDMARITLGVLTQAATANEAVQQNAEKMTRVINALKGMEIKEDDMETQWYSLYPMYSNSNPPLIIGYSVSNNIIADVYNLTAIGRVIDVAVEAGANQVQGVSFTLSEDKSKEMRLETLQRAAEDAKTKAETIAKSLGVEIIGVSNVSEATVWYQPYNMALEYGKAAPETPIIPGEVESSATLTVTYLIQ